jgi:hypothetical protein
MSCGKDDDGGDNSGNGNGNGDSGITAPATVALPIGPGTATFAITTNESWSISIADAPTWVSASPRTGEGNATITVTVTDFYVEALGTRTATLNINDKAVTLTQPPYVTEFPALVHPDEEGYYLLLGSTNYTGNATVTGFANAPDDEGDYFQYGGTKGYTKDDAWDGNTTTLTAEWSWGLWGFRTDLPSFFKTELLELLHIASAEEYGRFYGSANTLAYADGYLADFDEITTQWREADEVGNKIAGMFIGDNAEEATITDLKGTVFLPAAGYRAAADGTLKDHGVKGYYLGWSTDVFVVSEDGIELLINSTNDYNAKWNRRNAASMRAAFEKIYLNLSGE